MIQRPIELLAPAKNADCGIEAIRHGADAVYIGAPRFGARAAAGNSIEDIARLVSFAHQFRARVYVAVNTILQDEELKDTEAMVWDLYRAGADALIVQDMALLQLNLPPIPLHASTQMDNRSTEKVRFLQQQEFSQVVLARELTLQQIRTIHEACPSVPLEVFVHGALCVSYSGQCYVSQHCFNRSANRGNCAQFCRLKFNLVDADGRIIEQDKHLLSLKDMNQSDQLEQILAAGASSLKIEGRLKDMAYVKNVTAYYSQKLNAIIRNHPEYVRASSGESTYSFRPQLEKSFNRGFTHYFLNGRKADIFSFNTPKSLGEEMGYVKEIRGKSIIVAGVKPFNNGDGLCFMDENGKLQGFRVNRVDDSNKIYPVEMPQIKPRTRLYRNFDQEFDRLLSKPSAERVLGVRWRVGEYPDGFVLTLKDEDGVSVSVPFAMEKELARSPQDVNIYKQLSKLGGTIFECKAVDLDLQDNWFVPSSLWAEWRRQVVDRLMQARRVNFPVLYRKIPTEFTKTLRANQKKEDKPLQGVQLTYLANVMNRCAEAFYTSLGAVVSEPAYEKKEPKDAVLMFCKHCLRFSMGWCPKNGGRRSPFREPYYLVSGDGRRFRLEFDCKQCQMKVYADEAR